VECESLSSQINNFTLQFFGTVVKTEIDGEIQWSLPCSLDIGLENNPRGVDEGLACYFLRLFNEGIIGATGPQGATGADGADGKNAFTVTLASFTQPTLGSPNIQISTLYNPAILDQLYIFVEDSGWYQITATDGAGMLWVTLVKAVSGATGTITAGKLVVPSGFPGVSVVGPTGPQGATGPQGSPGVSHTATNGMYYAPVGTDYNLQIAYAAVDFVNSSARLLLPTAGTYQVTVSVDIIGLTGVATTDEVAFRLRNNETSLVVDGSEHKTSRIFEDQLRTVSFVVHTTTSDANQQITLQGKCTTVDKVAVVALRTTMTYVKLA
jgi:hypothetical protein